MANRDTHNDDVTSNSQPGDAAERVVDLRSDGLSRPTNDMMLAMTEATLGDDMFDEDPTVHKLQDEIAKMFGMEASLFVASGTMANLLAVMCHCDQRAMEVLCGSMSHIVIYEQGGAAQIGGVMVRTIPNNPDGTYDLDELESYIRPVNTLHQPNTGLITVESTHCNCGGAVIPLDFLAKLREQADELGLPIHMDAARLMNAAVAQGVQPRDILQYADSAMMCLSKGIGAPIGSVIAGSAKFIDKARRTRKVLGGGWRQAGPLAAAALVGLKDCRERIAVDHKHAKMFAQGVMETHSDRVSIDVAGVHTNIVMPDILKSGLTAEQFCDRLKQVTEAEATSLGERIIMLCTPFYKYTPRIITCHNNATEDIQAAIRKVRYVLDEAAART